MTGIVVVSHSVPLAEAAVALALEMATASPPRIVVAAGTADGRTGTDATRVADAIVAADDGGGVVVLMDLGSAVLSAELALELLPRPVEVRLVAAPFVEGLLAATVRAGGGAGIDEVAREAAGALAGKAAQLGGEAAGGASAGDGGAGAPAGAGVAGDVGDVGGVAPAAGTGGAGARAGTIPGGGAAAVEVATATVVLANSAGLHARPAAQFAAAAARLDADITVSAHGAPGVPAASPTALATLAARVGDALSITARGPGASAAVAALTTLVADRFGERGDDGGAGSRDARVSGGVGRGEAGDAGQGAASATPGRAGAAPGTVSARPGATGAAPGTGATPGADAGTGSSSGRAAGAGLGVSAGRVVGPALRMPDPIPAPDDQARIAPPGRDAAVERLSAAIAHVAASLRERAERADGPAADILEATAAMADDPVVAATASAAVRERGLTPERAAWNALGDVADLLRGAGGLQAERVTDVLDVRGRIVAELAGRPAPGIPSPDSPFVLVADDLAPADTAELVPGRCLAIVTARGGAASHTAIIARSRGIPAVVGFTRAARIRDGDTVLVDGATGEVVVDPSPEQIATVAPAR